MEEVSIASLHRFSFALDCILSSILAANLCFLGHNISIWEHNASFTTSSTVALLTLGFVAICLALKKAGYLTNQATAFIFVNCFGVYLIILAFVWQKSMFLFCLEIYRLMFLYLVRLLLATNNVSSVYVHSYSVIVWIIMCYFSGKFDGIDDKFVLFVLGSLCLFNEAVNIYSMNISTIRQREYIQKVIELKNQITSIFQSIPEVIFVVKNDLSIVLRNDAAESIIKQNSEQFLKTVRLKQDDNSNMKLSDRILQLIDQGEFAGLKLGKTKIGDKTFECKASSTSWEGKSAATLLLRDVTALILLEQAKHDDKLKNVMLRSVSHELRTPANAFTNLLERALSCIDLPDKARQILELAHDNCKHLLHVVNDLLDYSQFLHGSFRLAKCKFDVGHIVKSSFKPYKYMIKSAGLVSELFIDPEIPAFGFNDPNRISQVIMNLLSNATKFTRYGKIKLEAVMEGINTVRVSVTDTGVGISKEQQGNLCSLFGRLKENESLNPQGCGLGLHISNLLAIQLGNTELMVNSDIGLGTSFSFKFSLNEEESCDYTFQLDEEKLTFQLPLFNFEAPKKKGRVLIVDDNVFNRDIIVCILQDIGFEFFTASSGLGAIQAILENRDEPFKLMLLDFEMPELTGPQTARLLKQMQKNGEVDKLPAIVAYTAYSSEKDKQECKDAGMVDFLHKPCKSIEIQQLVLKYCT